MKINILSITIIFSIFIYSFNSQNTFISLAKLIINQTKLQNKTNGNNKTNENNTTEKDGNQNDIDYIDLIIKIFSSYYDKCGKDINLMNNGTYKKTVITKYPFIIDHIGKALNDLGDEIECRNALFQTTYVIAELEIKDFLNDIDKKLIDFLNITHFCIGACLTENCKEPLKDILGLLKRFTNKNETSSNNKKEAELIEEGKDIKKDSNNFIKIFFLVIFIYIGIKIFFGIFRLIYYPKGYDKHIAKIIKDKESSLKGNEENEDLNPRNNSESLINLIEESNPNEYNPNYDFTSYYPIYLRIIKFFDFFNDIEYFSTRRNRYFNDNGLESINFSRFIVLYMHIFSNTFTSLISLPSKDILNKSLFTSGYIILYRLSMSSLNFWIILEAAYTSYKLMKFIKAQMYEYSKKNTNCFYSLNLLIIFGKFTLLFIPKICTFLFCYYIFYYQILDFKIWLSATTTFKYITENVVNKYITCNSDCFSIFSNNLIFNNDISKFKTCYDFTFLYLNIFICVFVFMFLLYFSLIIQNKIFEIIFIIINIIIFFVLMIVVKDENISKDNIKYSFYHFKGQEYTTKIVYLSLGVYHLGFILGILCFNYDNYKNNWNKNINNKNSIDDLGTLIKDNEEEENNNKANQKNNNFNSNSRRSSIKNFNLPYYPLSFLNSVLNCLNKTNSAIRYLLILIFVALMFVFSFLYRFMDKKDHVKNEYYIFEMDLNVNLKNYFLFEKHALIILFFIINVIMITLPKVGIYKSLVKFKLNTAASRAGCTITCLYFILSYFSFCGFLVKIKFNFVTFFLISIGNFLIVFIVCIMLSMIFELPIRIIVKKILRINKKKK